MSARGPIVLVGGGGLGPWIWSRVTPLLEKRRFAVIAPQLRGTGNGRTPAAGITLSDWIDDLSEILAGVEQATLVAHSFAGYVAAGALSRVASHLRTVVFLDAVLPHPDASWFEAMGRQTEEYMRDIARDDGAPWFTREQLDQVYPNHGFTPAEMAWLQSNVSPQPIGTFAQAPIRHPIESLAPKGPAVHKWCKWRFLAGMTDEASGPPW